MKYIIVFKLPEGQLYYGRGWRPYASKKAAVRFATREAAQERIEGIRRVFEANPSFDQRLAQNATVEEVSS